MTIIIALLVISLLIFVHELGHFLAAKATGVMVLEFSIGRGPALWSRRIGETLYSLRLLPIGGYAQMAGEDIDPESGWEIAPKRRYDKKPTWARAIIALAGSTANFLSAVLMFALIFSMVGVPSSEPLVGSVAPDSPAAEAGIQAGDRILQINGKPVASWQEMQVLLDKWNGQSINALIDRGGQQVSFSLVPVTQDGRPLIGVSAAYEHYGILDSFSRGINRTASFTRDIITLLIGMLTGRVAAQGSGPVGMIVMVGQVASTGMLNLLIFTAIISIQLGVFNLLPIPALDGGKLVFLVIETLRGQPVKPEHEGMVHLLGFALLMVFMVVLTVQDLMRLRIL